MLTWLCDKLSPCGSTQGPKLIYTSILPAHTPQTHTYLERKVWTRSCVPGSCWLPFGDQEAGVTRTEKRQECRRTPGPWRRRRIAEWSCTEAHRMSSHESKSCLSLVSSRLQWRFTTDRAQIACIWAQPRGAQRDFKNTFICDGEGSEVWKSTLWLFSWVAWLISCATAPFVTPLVKTPTNAFSFSSQIWTTSGHLSSY